LFLGVGPLGVEPIERLPVDVFVLFVVRMAAVLDAARVAAHLRVAVLDAAGSHSSVISFAFVRAASNLVLALATAVCRRSLLATTPA